MVEWPNFRNFIGDNQIVMNKNKPLDQVRSTGANALNLTSKLVNKSEFNGSILERLMDFAIPSPISAGPTKVISVIDSPTSSYL